jgi:hypothetical protein
VSSVPERHRHKVIDPDDQVDRHQRIAHWRARGVLDRLDGIEDQERLVRREAIVEHRERSPDVGRPLACARLGGPALVAPAGGHDPADVADDCAGDELVGE